MARSLVSEWRDLVLSEDGPSSPTARLVGLAIAKRSDYRTGRDSYPSIETLARETGLGEKAVRRAVKLLASEEWIEVRKARRGDSRGLGKRWKRNTYALTVPDRDEKATAEPSEVRSERPDVRDNEVRSERPDVRERGPVFRDPKVRSERPTNYTLELSRKENTFPTGVGEADRKRKRKPNGDLTPRSPSDELRDDPDSWEDEEWGGRASRAAVELIHRECWQGSEPPSKAPASDWSVGHELRRLKALWRDAGGEAVWYLLHGAREAADGGEVPGVEPGESFTLGAVLCDPEAANIATHYGRRQAERPLSESLDRLLAGVGEALEGGARG